MKESPAPSVSTTLGPIGVLAVEPVPVEAEGAVHPAGAHGEAAAEAHRAAQQRLGLLLGDVAAGEKGVIDLFADALQKVGGQGVSSWRYSSPDWSVNSCCHSTEKS